jgi:hypothetical protein
VSLHEAKSFDYYARVDLDTLLAREAIRDLVVRYATYADGGRFADVLSLFAPDAVVEVDGGVYSGTGEIESIFTGAAGNAAVSFSGPARFKHLTGSHQIDLDSASTARGRCYVAVLMDTGLDHWGRYLDDYAIVEGNWRFTRRRIAIDGATEGGWRARLLEGMA